MDTRGGTLGGGEILQYIGNNQGRSVWYVDYSLEKQFMYMEAVKGIITALILFSLLMIILKAFNIKYLRQGKGIRLEIQNINDIRSRDTRIMRQTLRLKRLVEFWEKTPMRMNKLKKEYLDYNLARAGINGPNGRTLRAEEYNAMIQTVQLVGVIAGLVLMIVHSLIIGMAVAIASVLISSSVPTRVIRFTVMAKDDEIKANFSDMYLMIHYTLISGARTPLDRVLRSFARTTESKEMKRFVTNCCSRIDTYGEYGATQYIIKDYREIPEVTKLMRLIRQLREGADIEEELLAFRKELITERRLALEKHGTVLIAKARRSMLIVWVILFQAIISALAIYLPDLGGATAIFGLVG